MSTPSTHDGVDVTIAIVTRNRRELLRSAVRSALQQEGRVEVLVLDDGSADGTSDMVRDEFPSVRVARYDDNRGVAVRRNDAAALAKGPVIVSIDDDAVFTSPRIVADTLAEFDHPQIAAVAMPYIDVGMDPAVRQQAPDGEDRWVTSIFRATAYAIRRDLLLAIGGYDGRVDQFGEEWELSLRLLDAGHVIRLGRAEPIHHHESPRRSWRRMDILSRRNEQLIAWTYFPFPWNLISMAWYAVKGLRNGVRVRRRWIAVVGVAEGLKACVAARRDRQPISRAAFAFDRLVRARARDGAGVTLAEAAAQLQLPGPRPKPEAGGWPGPLARLHAPLRRARTTVVGKVGRPVRCEVCGGELFRVLPLVSGGRLNLLGAEQMPVRADWDKMNRMTFRHVDRDLCDRP
ncbi:MAG TPA: glycosyltransferase [Baekduia sp.]|nr:glycosyltransferase [Baekduia sp.]